MRLRTIFSVLVSLFVLQLPVADRLGAVAVAAATDVCHDARPLAVLPADDGIAAQPLDAATLNQLALKKAQANDPERGNRDLSTGRPDVLAAQAARKMAAMRSGRAQGSASVFTDRASALRACATAKQSASIASTFAAIGDALTSRAAAGSAYGYAWVDNLDQQGQWHSSWCGPATVSEIAHTMYYDGRGAIPVDQGTAANAMYTTGDGTNVGNFVNGLNTYVGRPVAGWNYYWFVWLSYNPTSTERSNFVSNLEFDVNYGWPVGGDAWEVAYGPHLRGHPYNQTIFHYIELGGYGASSGSVYYADSATTVWSTVPPYSWFDMQTMITILGGRGYAW
jgi:hypothetical protein